MASLGLAAAAQPLSLELVQVGHEVGPGPDVRLVLLDDLLPVPVMSDPEGVAPLGGAHDTDVEGVQLVVDDRGRRHG